jgi:hypothetical protein
MLKGFGSWVTRGWVRRCGIAASAAALASGTFATALAAPASASTPTNLLGKTTLVLTNLPQYGTFAAAGVTPDSVIEVDQKPGQWAFNDLETKWSGGSPRITGEQIEFRSIYTSGNESNLCLADAGTGFAYLDTCGNNGTIWVAVVSGNGTYLYSRYWTNQGDNLVLNVHNPSNDQFVGLYAPQILKSGDGNYARWKFDDPDQ